MKDHKQLGKQLGLFVFSDTVGQGLPLWTPKGATVRRVLERFIVDEELKRGYQHVYTPDLAKTALYEKSGHYPYYQNSMYPPMQIDEDSFMLRPMTCPHHFELYASVPRSYRELPIRYAELAHLYRYEKSGELSGLERCRMFTLSDAHIITRKEDAAMEVANALLLIKDIAAKLGFPDELYSYRLSLGDPKNTKKYFADAFQWGFAEGVLRQTLEGLGMAYVVAEDEAAFYGPKIDVQMKNSNGKEETVFTVQYDFVLPQRFDLKYVDKNGQNKQPIVIHRSSVGAIERIVAFLIEFYAGAFPTWLAPVQVVLIPINKTHEAAAQEQLSGLRMLNIRAEMWPAEKWFQQRIKEAEQEKVPYIGIIGDKEIADGTMSIRARGGKNLGQMNILKLFAEMM